MTPQKLTGFHKFVCFVIVAIIVILVIGFVANGWKADENIPGSGDVGNSTNDTDENLTNNGTIKDDTLDNTGSQNNSGESPPNSESEPTEAPTIYKHLLTGLEISKGRYDCVPLAVVINPSAPSYGVSNADIAIEFPIEDGTTRMVVYDSSEQTLWKIGAVMPTRKFISAISIFFGGIIISYASDDKIEYDVAHQNSFVLDISKHQDCYYMENAELVYTSETMVETAKLNTSNYQPIYQYKTAPYDFYDTPTRVGMGSASAIIIPHSDKSGTELYYNEKSGKYFYYKSATPKNDMLTGESISYKNVFILFANSTTYEKAEGNQLVVDIFSGGKGYYASDGNYIEFVWKTTSTGELSFFTLSGEKLKVNPGNAYFTYYKSSFSSNIKFI